MSRSFILLLILVTIVAISVGLYFSLSDSTDIGDFTYTTTNDTKKYDSVIRKGIAKWADMGVKGTHIYFKKESTGVNFNNTISNTIAKTSGNTIFIVQSVFDNLSSDKQRIMTITHEVGHVLGIGLWGSENVSTSGGQSYLNETKFPETAKAYIDHYRPSGITLPGPPIENDGGQGTASVHWEDNPTYGLHKSIMGGTIRTNSDLITIVDLTYLKEIGVKVDDVNKGQKFTIFYQLRDLIIKDKKINE
tara:strand:+ start:876 stop:1619 length:744 start_codon:yes stop_codon:yes gene_type:complete